MISNLPLETIQYNCRHSENTVFDAKHLWTAAPRAPLFRKFGVDAVITSRDHIIERCLTSPDGFEAKMDAFNPENLNLFVIGNAGRASRGEAESWLLQLLKNTLIYNGVNQRGFRRMTCREVE